MLVQFGHVGLFLIVVFLFTASLPLAALSFRFLKMTPHNPDRVKTSTYESGMKPIGKSWVQFNFRYYNYALIFVALDVTAVFLYAWAVNVKELSVFGLVAAAIFIAVLTIAYVYAWKKRALEWK